MKLRWNPLKSFILIVLLLASCARTSQVAKTPISVKVTETLTPKVLVQTETPVPLPTEKTSPTATWVFPTDWWHPTSSELQKEKLFISLKDETCKLPCYLGIFPGQTNFDDANSKLLDFGARHHKLSEEAYNDEELQKHYYYIDIGGTTFTIQQYIDLYVYDERVIRMDVRVVSWKDQTFHKYWSSYSVNTLLHQLGVPDAVYLWHDLDETNSVQVQYNEAGIFLENSMISQDDKLVCLGFSKDSITDIFMILFDPKDPDILAAFDQIDKISMFNFPDGLLQVDTQILLPIETVLNIGPEQFYEQMTANPDICYERPKTLP